MSLMPKLEQAYFADTKPSQEELLGFRKLFSKYENAALSEDQIVTLAQNARSLNLDLAAELGQDYYQNKLAQQITNQRKNLGTEKYYTGDLGALGGIDSATQYMASRLVLSGIRDISEIGEKTQKALGPDYSNIPQAQQDYADWYKAGGYRGQDNGSVVDYNGKKYYLASTKVGSGVNFEGSGEDYYEPVLIPINPIGEQEKVLYNKRTGEQLKQGHDVGYAYANTSVSPDNPNARYTIGGTFAGKNTGLNISMVNGIPMFYTTPGPSSAFISKESIGPVLAIASMMVPGLGIAIGSTITGALGVTVSSAVAGAIGTGVLTTIASGGDVKKGAIAAATSYFVPQIAGEIGDAAGNIFESAAGKKLVENISAAALRTAALGGNAEQIESAVLGATAGGMFDVVVNNLPGFSDITDPKTRAAIVASVQNALDAPGDLSNKFQAAALSGATTLGLSKIDIDGKKFTDLTPGQQSIVTTALGRELAGKPLTSNDIFKTVIDAVSKEVRADIQKERQPAKPAEVKTQPVTKAEIAAESDAILASDADGLAGLSNEDLTKGFSTEVTPDELGAILGSDNAEDLGLPSEFEDIQDTEFLFPKTPSTDLKTGPISQFATLPRTELTGAAEDFFGPSGDQDFGGVLSGETGVEDYEEFDPEILRSLIDDMGLASDLDLEGIQRGFADIGSEFKGQLNTVVKNITDKVNEYEAYGATRDEALSAAIENMADSLGQTKETFLGLLGETESSLNDRIVSSEKLFAEQVSGLETTLTDRISAFERAGLSRNEAIQRSITELSDEMGETEESLLQKIGTTESALKGQLSAGLADVTTKLGEQVGELKTDLLDRIKTLEEAGYTRDEAISSAVAELSDELGTTREDFLKQLGSTESGLKTEMSDLETRLGEQIGGVKSDIAGLEKSYETRLASAVKDITDQVNEYEAYGATRDEALQAALDNVSESLGIAQDELLSQLGETQESLNARIIESEQLFAAQISGVQTDLVDRIKAFENAGLSRDQAINQSITELADELGETEEGLLQKLGVTEQSLKSEIGDVESRLGTQIGDVQSQIVGQGLEYATKLATAVDDITAQINEYEAYGATRDEALQAALDNVSEQLGITTQQLLEQLNLSQSELNAQITLAEQEYARQFSDIGERIGGVSEEVSGVKTGLSELGKTVGEQVSGLGSKVTGIERALAQQPGQFQQMLDALQRGFGTQVSGLQSQLLAQQKAQQAQAAQQEAALRAPKFETFYANIPGYKPFDLDRFSSDFYGEE